MANERGLIAPAVILGGCMMVGLIVGGSLLGAQIKAIRLADRYVTVGGYSNDQQADASIMKGTRGRDDRLRSVK